jgi:hypothetical protein
MQPAETTDWITLHRVRFPQPLSSIERVFPQAPGALVWRFCPHFDVGEDGLPTRRSAIWGAMGIWPSREAAEASLNHPAAAMPWLSETSASWHCLAVPIAHRGQVNWRGEIEDGTAIRPAPQDPGGPLIVITSAAFNQVTDATLPRIKRFVAGVAEVLDWYGTLPGNLRRAVFYGGHDGREGFTLSLWRSDDAMREAAYNPGRHRSRMDEGRAGLLMDRSSFTRLRAIRSSGDWEGDPFAVLRQGMSTSEIVAMNGGQRG